MSENGKVAIQIKDGVATITFSHPLSNCLPSTLLKKIAEHIGACSRDDEVHVILLQSGGEEAFCAGASFEELLASETLEKSRDFFSGFAEVIIAMKRSPKIIVTRVQGKTVGGGIGLIAASDFVLATKQASVKLSEFSIGLGPFIIGPVIQDKIGKAHFNNLALSTDWRPPYWAKEVGLFSEVYQNALELDKALRDYIKKALEFSPEAIKAFKEYDLDTIRELEETVPDRVETTSTLAISKYTREKITSFRKNSSKKKSEDKSEE